MSDIRNIIKKCGELYFEGLSAMEISKKLKVSEIIIYRILSGLDSPIKRGPNPKNKKIDPKTDRFP